MHVFFHQPPGDNSADLEQNVILEDLPSSSLIKDDWMSFLQAD